MDFGLNQFFSRSNPDVFSFVDIGRHRFPSFERILSKMDEIAFEFRCTMNGSVINQIMTDLKVFSMG
jgi:hypothetical protein